LTWDAIEQRDANFSRNWLDAFPALPAPRGELYSSFRKRVLNTIDEISSSEKARNIAVVTHAGVMRVVLQTRLGYCEQDAWEKTRSYCSSFEYRLEAGVRKAIQ
jgi:broad specificity phosphatase PhoE